MRIFVISIKYFWHLNTFYNLFVANSNVKHFVFKAEFCQKEIYSFFFINLCLTLTAIFGLIIIVRGP